MFSVFTQRNESLNLAIERLFSVESLNLRMPDKRHKNWLNEKKLVLLPGLPSAVRYISYFFCFLFFVLVTRKASVKMPQVPQRRSHVPQGR